MPHEVAHLHRGLSGHARDERAHLGKPDIEFGIRYLCIRGSDGGLGGANPGPGLQRLLFVIVQLTLRNRPLLGQGGVTAHVDLGEPLLCLSLAELTLRLPELPLRLLQRVLEGSRVNLKQHLPLRNRRSFTVQLPYQVSTHLRLDLCVHKAIQRSDPLSLERNVRGGRPDH